MISIKGIIKIILDIVLPKEEIILNIENMSEMEISENIPGAFELKDPNQKSLFQYKNKTAKQAIWAIKYCKNRKIIQTFSKLFYEFILENLAEEAVFYNFNNPILVAIPMYKDDIKERGYNQSELIAQEIFKTDNGKNFILPKNALTKIYRTEHQSKLKNRNERLKNLQDCFWADEKIVKDRNIILLDDVITTGATMKTASNALYKAGAKKVICFSLAH